MKRAAVGVALLAGLAACSSSGGSAPASRAASTPATVTISGTVVTDDIIGAGSNGCQTPGGKYEDVPGMEIDITDGGGAVIAVTHLAAQTSGKIAQDDGFYGCGYPFSASVPRATVYGFKLDGQQAPNHISDLSQAVMISLRR